PAGLAPSILPRYKARDGFAPCLCRSFPSLPRLVSPLWSSVPFVGGWRVGRRLPIDGRLRANPARLAKKIFVAQGPEARFSSREGNEVQPFGGTDRLGQARAELRLRVLRALPP